MVLLGLASNSSPTSSSSPSSSAETTIESSLNATLQNFTISKIGGIGQDVEQADPLYNYLPLCAIVLAAIGYHIGLSPITWSYMGKLAYLSLIHWLGSKDVPTIVTVFSSGSHLNGITLGLTLGLTLCLASPRRHQCH